MRARLRLPAALGLALAVLVQPAALGDAAAQSALERGRYGERPPVQVDPDLAAAWLLQLAPGSGVVPGYRRPDLSRPAVAASTPTGVVLDRRPTGSVAGSGAARSLETRAAPPGFAAVYGVSADGRARIVRGAGQPQAQAGYRQVAPRPTMDPRFLPTQVRYEGRQKPGTIIVDTRNKFLYLVESGGTARRYGVGVGKEGFGWSGTQRVSRKAEWPGWTPPAQMRARERAKGRILPAHMPGGPDNPLGARALYLGSTLYRIHGTNQPWTIGQAVSSGCIRMRNEDVVDLYERVAVGARVIVT